MVAATDSDGNTYFEIFQVVGTSRPRYCRLNSALLTSVRRGRLPLCHLAVQPLINKGQVGIGLVPLPGLK